MLNPKQVDISIIFPELNTAEGHPSSPMPEFLSGEKKQAIRTSVLIPPVKRVGKINWECNHTQLQNYLYVLQFYPHSTTTLILFRSKYSIDLNRDLDDAAVSLLIENGLGDRFPTACDTWKSCNAESKENTWRSISEKKQNINEELKDNQPLLDALVREITRRILEVHPYVFNLSLKHKSLTFN